MSAFHEKTVADKVSLICDRWRRGLPLFEAPLPAPDFLRPGSFATASPSKWHGLD